MDASPVESPTATDEPPRPRRSRRTDEQVFTHVPSAGCALITRATVDTYAPGTTCQVETDSTIGDWTTLDVITANIDVRTRNVVVEVSYGPPATGSAPALSEQQGEHAVRTMVAEVLRQLS